MGLKEKRRGKTNFLFKLSLRSQAAKGEMAARGIRFG
jgi:hypothetical protein